MRQLRFGYGSGAWGIAVGCFFVFDWMMTRLMRSQIFLSCSWLECGYGVVGVGGWVSGLAEFRLIVVLCRVGSCFVIFVRSYGMLLWGWAWCRSIASDRDCWGGFLQNLSRCCFRMRMIGLLRVADVCVRAYGVAFGRQVIAAVCWVLGGWLL